MKEKNNPSEAFNKLGAKPQRDSTPEKKKRPLVFHSEKTESSPLPIYKHKNKSTLSDKSVLPWKSVEDFSNALVKDEPSESTLKSYAKILGIDYNSHFETFYSEASRRFKEILD
jgi:hypothetical protein